jgi:hypothetical protein
MKTAILRTLVASALALGAPASALAVTITFNELAHGQHSHKLTFGPVTIWGHNNGGPDALVAFDTNPDRRVADPDLQGPRWAGGNISSAHLGRILILPEQVIDRNGDGLVDWPDDVLEGGAFDISFADPISEFGFDLVDIEGSEMGAISFHFEGSKVAKLTFADLRKRDKSISWGDRTANRILPITALELGVQAFDRIKIHLVGTGGIDNLTYDDDFPPIPEPTGLGAAALGLAGLAALGRRRR